MDGSISTEEVIYAERAYVALVQLLRINPPSRFGIQTDSDYVNHDRARVCHTIASLVRAYGHVSKEIGKNPLDILSNRLYNNSSRKPDPFLPFERGV